MVKGQIRDDLSVVDAADPALIAGAPNKEFGALERVDALLAGALELAESITDAYADEARPLLEAIVEARLAALRLGEDTV